MGSPPRLTRRRLLTTAAAVAALTRSPTRAQTPTDPTCALGFVHGLLQFAPECPLLDPPGTTTGEVDYEIAPPHHLVALVTATDGASGTGTDEGEEGFVPQSGSRRKRKKARLHRRSKQRRHKGRHKHGGGGTDTTTTPTTP